MHGVSASETTAARSERTTTELVPVVATIHRRLSDLSPAEAQVARFVLDNLSDVPFASLQSVATRSGTSDATVMRFCASLSFSGFQDFKTTLTAELIERGATTTGDGTAERYARTLADDLVRTIESVGDDRIERAATAIRGARLTVAVGIAGSAAVAHILATGLLSANVVAVDASDRVDIERWSALAGPGDVVIGISHSGAAHEVEAAVRRAGANGATTIAVTNADRSGLATAADIALVTAATERILGSNACHPRIVELALLELVLDAVARRR